MSEQQTPSREQTHIQVQDWRDEKWKLGEEIIIEGFNKELQKIQKVAAIVLHYEEMHSMEMNFAKNPLLFFGDSQKARNRAAIYKQKAIGFKKWVNILISEMSL
jgi:hypothetical protein